MKATRQLYLLLVCSIGILLTSCSQEKHINIDYSFEVAKDVKQEVSNFEQVKFSSDKNLDLGFYEGQVWIKLNVSNGKIPASYVVLCNDLINHNYRFYKLDTLKNKFSLCRKKIDQEKYDHRTFGFAKPNFLIELGAYEEGTFLITTSSDGRIIQATPELLSLDQFQTVKQRMFTFDFVFYCSIGLLLLINLFYFRLIRSDIYYYYGAYIVSGCLMYLFVEGRIYGLGMSTTLTDHLMFISIRVWVLSGLLFTLKFLETKKTNPTYYKFIIVLLFLTLGLTTVYQFICASFSISTLHKIENIIGFIWILLCLLTVGIAYKKRKVQSNYYLISYSALILFVTLGLIDSHTTTLPGDPFSYFKIGTILEFIGFTYFITLLVKQELSVNRSVLQEKEKLLASNTSLVSVFRLIENSFNNESDWDDFKQRFESLNPNFVSFLITKHSNLSKSDIRLLTLIRTGYTQKEIADILNIAPASVKKARSRVRNKLNLPNSVILTDYLHSI